MSPHRLLPLVLVLAVATACGDDDAGSAPARQELSDTEHNDADVAFATEMVPHHAEALVMVDLTQGRDLDPEVQQLAEQIRAAQTPEVETMAGWLVSWGEDVPETVRDHANADHGGGHEGDLGELEATEGAQFQERWLELMVEHHEDAVAMAQDEQADGRFRPAVELAGRIVETQTEEIETMQGLMQ